MTQAGICLCGFIKKGNNKSQDSFLKFDIELYKNNIFVRSCGSQTFSVENGLIPDFQIYNSELTNNEYIRNFENEKKSKQVLNPQMLITTVQNFEIFSSMMGQLIRFEIIGYLIDFNKD